MTQNGFRPKTTMAVISMVLVSSSFLVWMYFLPGNENQNKIEDENLIDMKSQLRFIPQPIETCDDLFKSGISSKFNFTPAYRNSVADFQAAIKQVYQGNFDVEGHIGLFPKQHLALHYVAGLDFVRHVCETGFNAGHSSLTFLTAKPDIVVHSFDISQYSYTKPMTEYMEKAFQGRFFAHLGDSTKTLPEFIRKNPDLKCDVIFVDGGHTYKVAKSDLVNFRRITTRSTNVVIFDDYPTPGGVAHGQAWEESISNKHLEEFMRCTRKFDKRRGFTIGRFRNILFESGVDPCL